jgi:Tfp pilus assembly protein PilZ
MPLREVSRLGARAEEEWGEGVCDLPATVERDASRHGALAAQLERDPDPASGPRAKMESHARLIPESDRPVRPKLAPGSDRRRSARRKCLMRLDLTDGSEFVCGLSEDVSAGGVVVWTHARAPIGAHLALSFELPDGTAVNVRGEVRWREDARTHGQRARMGIAFRGLSSDLEKHIAAFCEPRRRLHA